MRFVKFTLELQSPLHIGAGRAGMLARSHGFVPGHIVTFALAAAIGRVHGGRYEHFADAFKEVQTQLRCGPLFICDAEQQQPFWPHRHRLDIEARYLDAINHVALELQSASAVEGALFEVEQIAPRCLHGPHQGQPTRLIGGLWFQEAKLDDRPWKDWLNQSLLGGELKTGLGRVRVLDDQWNLDAGDYAGLGTVDGLGLQVLAGDLLPGPSLNGTKDAPLQPWLGRLFDPQQGFGRRFSPPALVRLDGVVQATGVFLPSDHEVGLGCWTRTDAPAH